MFIATTVSYEVALKYEIRKATFIKILPKFCLIWALKKNKKQKQNIFAKTSYKIVFSCSVCSQQWCRYVSFNLLSSAGFSLWPMTQWELEASGGCCSDQSIWLRFHWLAESVISE